MTTPTLNELLQTLPQIGTLTWIGLRPGRSEPMVACDSVRAEPGSGLEGDRFRGRLQSKRQVTLIQAEHLPVIGSLLHRDTPDPGLIRRNLVVSGINLLALKGRCFRIGEVVLEMTGLCHPCSKMEALFGPGGYNALRGHGGITARVLKGGLIRRGDPVSVCDPDTD